MCVLGMEFYFIFIVVLTQPRTPRSEGSVGLIWLLSVKDSLHRYKSRICLAGPAGNQTELSAKMKSCLRVFDHIHDRSSLPPSLPTLLSTLMKV